MQNDDATKPGGSANAGAPAGTRAVLLVGESVPVLLGLSCLMLSDSSGIRLAGYACTTSEALKFCSNVRPDAAVLDINPGEEGALRLLRVFSSIALPTVVLAWSDDVQMRERVLAGGARALVSKAAPADELLAALRAIFDEHGRQDPGC